MAQQFLLDAAIYVGLATVLLLVLVFYNPRLMLQDYPPSFKAVVPPKTQQEKRLSTWLGMPFLLVLLLYPIYATFVFRSSREAGTGFLQLWLYAFGIAFAFNLWDWLVLDWLVFCTFTPNAFVLPGSEGHPAYKDYAFHFRGFLIGTGFSALMGLIAAGIYTLIRAPEVPLSETRAVQATIRQQIERLEAERPERMQPGRLTSEVEAMRNPDQATTSTDRTPSDMK